MFKRSRHNNSSNSSNFIFTPDYYDLPKQTIRAKRFIYHLFKRKTFRDVKNLYQDKASMDMSLQVFKNLLAFCLEQKNQPPTIGITKDKHTGRYHLILNSLFIPNSSPF